MLRPRIIPALLMRQRGLVKTRQFRDPRYVGDPVNAVRIFNEKEVDELAVFDIDAASSGAGPDYDIIAKLAAECRMPLCYGGGVRTPEQGQRVVSLGVEKVALGPAFMEQPGIVSSLATLIGSQSVVVVLDVKRDPGTGAYEVWTHNATRNTGRNPADAARQAEQLGAGEIVINSIDRDGMMEGYDLALARSVRDAVTLPLTVLGGAGKLDHIAELVREVGIVGAAAGSLFVFKGVYRAVLINYPSRAQRAAINAIARAARTARYLVGCFVCHAPPYWAALWQH